MKKLVLICLLFICAEISHADGWFYSVGENPSGDGCGIGGLKYSIHCESLTITSGTPAGCVDTGEDATMTGNSGSAIDTDGTPVPIDGVGTCQNDATFGAFQVTLANTTVLIAEGKVTGYVNPASFTNAYLFFHNVDANNSLSVTLIDTWGDARINFNHKSNGTTKVATTTDGSGQTTVASGEWFYFEVEWKENVAGNDCQIKICDSAGTNCSVQEFDLDMPTNNATYSNEVFEFGYSGGNTLNGHFDDLDVYNDSKY